MFSSLRVVECGHFLAGPIAGQVMSWLGAEVIKVESVQRMDGARTRTRIYSEQSYEKSAMFNYHNLGKLGITLNLRDPRGVELFKRLIGKSDALIENFSGGVMDRLGLSYDTLTRENPLLVQLSVAGFGRTGTWGSYPSFAQSLGQLSGRSHLTGYADGPPLGDAGGGADPPNGVMAAFALIAALRERKHTGRGRLIDFSQLEATTAMLGHVVLDVEATGRSQARAANSHPVHCPNGTYQCNDDAWVAISVRDDRDWAAFLVASDAPEFGAACFATVSQRRERQEELERLVTSWASRHESSIVVRGLADAGIPCSIVATPERVLGDPHLAQRNVFFPLDRPHTGTSRYLRFPGRLKSVRDRLPTPSPTLGEHNERVLGDLLGLSSEEISELRNASVIGTEPLDARV